MSGAFLGGLDPASLDPASLGGLDPAGWACSEGGEIKNGEPQCKEDEKEYALFQIHVCKLLCTYVCTVCNYCKLCMYVCGASAQGLRGRNDIDMIW